MYKIPEPGDIYVRWDGETVQVAGLCHDEGGNLCVEYDTKDEPGQLISIDGWLGVEIFESFPYPRRFEPIEEFEEESDEVKNEDTAGPTRKMKLAVLEGALNASDKPIPYLPVKTKDK